MVVKTNLHTSRDYENVRHSESQGYISTESHHISDEIQLLVVVFLQFLTRVIINQSCQFCRVLYQIITSVTETKRQKIICRTVYKSFESILLLTLKTTVYKSDCVSYYNLFLYLFIKSSSNKKFWKNSYVCHDSG